MVDVKKFIWIFVIIGGLTIFIALLTPMACYIYRSTSFNTDYYLWMINLFFSYRYESGIHTTRIEFDFQLISFIPSIICTAIIIILSITTIKTAINYRKRESIPKISWLILGLIVLFATVFWMIMIEISRWVLYDHSFWANLSPGFGIIGLFVGAGLEIVGYIFLKKNIRNG
ncbi:MAG: hypothetical protein ACFE9S_20255 [Candidatus Hermodarchaeota archaeon]